MFGIGGNELLIIAVFALIIFGPDKIPEIARTAGKAIQMFKKAQADVEHVIKTEIYPVAEMLDPFGPSGSNAATSAASTAAIEAEQAASASAIWAEAVDNEDEEGEEE